VAAISAAHFQHIAKASRGDHAKFRAFAFQQSIRTNRGAMNHRCHARCTAKRTQTGQEAGCLITALTWHFRGLKVACCWIEQKKIGEGATDINADNRAAHWPRPS
jgi:hypothetical protein